VKSTLVRILAFGAAVAMVGGLAACSRAQRNPEPVHDSGPAQALHLGYFPNVTHAAALVGVDKGFFARRLGGTKLVGAQFSAGPAAAAALLGGSLDAAFLGTGPAINAYAKSHGKVVRLVAGATSGGVELVVRPGIHSPADLAGRTIATPQLGNTQDIACKTWLAKHHLAGRTTVTNVANPQTLAAYRSGSVAGAWVPEPWASRLVLQGGAHVLTRASDTWPDGQVPTTVLLVRTKFLHAHPETVRALLAGELDAIRWARTHKAGAEHAVNHQLKTLAGQTLPHRVLDRAFDHMRLTTDPYPDTFATLAAERVSAGITEKAPDVRGMADLAALHAVRARNES
jgi:NitT/TauT family transport system substrate-binding protein